jgi:plasmid stabilization system protein ParE
LESVVRFIAKDNPEAAVRVGNALIDRASILENFPLLGSPYPKRPGVRKLVSRPYVIFYRVRLEDNSVDILRYWHASRGDPEW